MKIPATNLFAAVIRALSTYRNAAIIVPIFFGIVSVLLGADTNWDLQNYHLYNAYAFLHGKLDIDLAPAGFQTYFNPMLDVPFFLAMEHLPPRLAGFLMGALHGLNFVLLLGICRIALPRLTAQERTYIPTLLTVAGVLTANFLSEVGSSMGDDTTALFCLGSILVVLAAYGRVESNQQIRWTFSLVAGLLMGMSVGLKLTNAPYAVAVCLALLVFPFSWMSRIKLAFLFGIGVLAGIALMNGYWFYTMWVKFGNPLFPQFNNVFQNPLAASVAVGDTSWLPKTFWQQILWPFIISADAQKVGQINIRQIIWAIAYFLLICFAAKMLYLKLRGNKLATLMTMERFVIVVVAVGFLIWMKLFSIYRYMVPMDLLAPLAVFILCKAVFPYVWAKRVAGVSLTIAVLIVLSGTRTWWHEPWGENLLHAEIPALADPARTTVLTIEGDPPWAWLAIAFPVKVAFVQIQGNFPQGPKYKERVNEILLERNGPTFVQFSGHLDEDVEKATKIRRQIEQLGLTKNADRCEALEWVVQKLKLRASVMPLTDQSGTACYLDIKARNSKRNIEAENRAEREKAQAALTKFGLAFQEQSCQFYQAGVARDNRVYQWCTVTLPGR